MANKPEVIDVTREVRKAERKRRRAERLERIRDWWDDNKIYVVTILPALGFAVGKTVKVVGRNLNLRMEERTKDLRCYDTSLGHYWELRRKLTNDDWTAINRRRDRGESLGEILASMNVLK